MSGGGGSYSSVPNAVCPCEKLVFTAFVQSPLTTVLSSLAVGDVLEVEKQGTNGPIMVKHSHHGNVGSVVKNVVDLLRCIDEGYQYAATIIKIAGSQIAVEIRPK